MAANRYGQIWHGNHHHINIRFPSNEARLKFQNEFEAYHASHDHEGDIPTFINVTTKDLKLSTGSRSPQDLVKAETDAAYRITIDGYSWNEIHDYHNPRGFSDYFWYHVPTCCVPPIIVVDREFVDSGTLQRHELSAVFQDMPDDEFLALIESVATKGIIDNVIKIHEGQILDGWHRYRACQELNILRKLRFQEWDTQKDGDPIDFVSAKNLDRRRHTQSQVAQILLHLAERYGHGGDRSKSSQETLKTLEEIAKKGNLSVSTMKRASAVQKLGDEKVKAVMQGKVAATKVLAEAKRQKDDCKRELVKILKTEGVLNVVTANMHELAE